MTTRSAVAIRGASLDDAAELADLNTQLGYPADAASIVHRLRPILASRNDAVLVAVDDAFRSRGIGRALLERAEAWARERGVSVLQVRSRVTRERAHAFYEREGYERIKTAYVFRKRLV